MKPNFSTQNNKIKPKLYHNHNVKEISLETITYISSK